MPDDSLNRTGRDAVQTPPAAAHVQKRALVTVEAPESIAAANIPGQTFPAGMAQIIIHFKHDTPGTFYHNITACISFIIVLYLSTGDADI